ncbi:1,4-alpha-glucan branching enzyme GlgB [Mannheimia haemolytica]|nr:1,4-alpha-glucan branching enzyme GlgB [Mannheimia haemolytica]
MQDYTYSEKDAFFVERLSSGSCNDPFSYLGIHPSNNGVIIRVFLPSAIACQVIDLNGKPVSSMLKIDDRGFFIAELIGKKTDFSYRLLVEYPDSTVDIEDPYRFKTHIQELDNWLFAEGKQLRPYEKLGAHLVTQNEVGVCILASGRRTLSGFPWLGISTTGTAWYIQCDSTPIPVFGIFSCRM